MSISWGAWSVLAGLDGESIAGGGQADSSVVIDTEDTLGCQVSVTVAYGSTANAAVVELLQDVDGTNYEGSTSAPIALVVPGSSSATVRRTFSVASLRLAEALVRARNPSGNSSITVTARVRYATAAA